MNYDLPTYEGSYHGKGFQMTTPPQIMINENSAKIQDGFQYQQTLEPEIGTSFQSEILDKKQKS